MKTLISYMSYIKMNIDEEVALVKGLHYLVASAQEGSYTKAAAKINSYQPNISTGIRKFEELTKVKVFSKISHGVVLTHEGSEILKYGERLRTILYEVKNYATQAHSMEGNINLWLTDGIGSCLMPHIAGFQNEFPEVKITFIGSNDQPAYSQRDADIAVVYELPRKDEPVDLKEFTIRFGLFASPEYFKKYGQPKSLDDLLANHRLCDRNDYNNTWQKWREMIGQARHIVNHTDKTSHLIEATKNGIGIGLHPLSYGLKEQGFERVGFDFELSHSCYVVSNKNDKNYEKIKKLRSCIMQAMQEF